MIYNDGKRIEAKPQPWYKFRPLQPVNETPEPVNETPEPVNGSR